MNKENFEFPKAEVEEIETKDIITTSPTEGDNDVPYPWSLRH